MFFANATYDSTEFGRLNIAICSDMATEELWTTETEGPLQRVYYGRPIADAIMRAAAKGSTPVLFECNGVRYTLIKYIFNDSERLYNNYRKNHVIQKMHIKDYKCINVYTERCRCTACYYEYGWDSIENICGIVKLRDEPWKSVEVDMQYCQNCNNFFIDAQSLAAYERQYGLLLIVKRHITGNEDYQDRDEYTYAKDTVLSRNGYSTRLLAYQRREILQRLLDSGKCSKAEIKDILTRFIRQRGERCQDAKVAWSSDLEYVNQYNIHLERRFLFE